MRPRCGGLCIVAVAAFFGVDFASATFLHPDHRAYRDIEILQVRGYGIIPATTIRPYTRRQIACGIASLSSHRSEMSEYERTILDRLAVEFAHDIRLLADSSSSRGKTPDWSVRADINPRLIGQHNPVRLDQPRAHRLPAAHTLPTERIRAINTLDIEAEVGKSLSVATRMELDTDGLGDNDYNGLNETTLGSTGQVEAAYISYESSWALVWFGRMPVIWGPGRQGNLILSDNAQTTAALSGTVRLGWLHFTAFTGELEFEPTADYYVPYRRYLAGHRLVFTPAPWVEIGLAETVVYGGINQSLSLSSSNPFAWYYAEEINGNVGETNNTFGLADITAQPLRGLETYAAFLVDDISVDRKSPDRYAWTAGLRWEAPLGLDRFGLSVEYTRLLRWVYNYANDAGYLRYYNRNGVIGHFLGPDGDALFLEGRWDTKGGARLTGLVTHRRQGETRYDSRFPVDAPSANFGYRRDPFPFGTVEIATTAEVLVSLPPFFGAYVSAAFIGAYVSAAFIGQTMKNPNHADAPRSWDFGLRLDVDWHIPVRF